MPHLNNKQNKNTNQILSRHDYHLTQPCPSEEKQTNKNSALISPYLKLTQTTVPTLKWSEVAQLCPTLCHPMDCNLQRSSIHGIFQAKVLEWVAISFSRGSSQPRDQTWASHIVGRCFMIWATKRRRAETKRKKEFNLLQGKNSTFLEAWEKETSNTIT